MLQFKNRKERYNIDYSSNYIALLLGFLLIGTILLELIVNIKYGQFDLFRTSNNTYTNLLTSKIISAPLTALPIVYFIIVQLGLHCLFIIYSYFSFRYYYNFIINNFVNNINFSLSLIFFTAVNYFAILILNNNNYPNSKFAFTSDYLWLVNNKFIYILAVLLLTINFILALLYLSNRYFKSNVSKLILLLLSLLIITNILYPSKLNFIYNFFSSDKSTLAHKSKPNVILITVDSARVDYIEKMFTSNRFEHNKLDIPSFYNNAVKFQNAYTPLARSFPALYSVLSGNYPKTENIRYNLTNQDNINFNNLLPHILSKNGYTTFYSTDSNQFHIINKNWGYQYLATPKQGIYEQILPNMNDFPLSNLIINHSISSLLFPYTYSNVSAKATYSPSSYLNRIYSSLDNLNKNDPLFLHFNFEGAHWPYMNKNLGSNIIFQDRYRISLNLVNYQISKVFDYLIENKILNNSIVILLSDHGESLSLYNDKLTNQDNYIGNKKYLDLMNKSPVNYTFNEIDKLSKKTGKNLIDLLLDTNSSGGHGVDVLSDSQNKVIAAIQAYDNQQKPLYNNKTIDNLVVLNDMYPTVLELLNINNIFNNTDSISLADLITNNQKNIHYTNSLLDTRYIYIETGLQVPYFEVKELENTNTLRSFISTWVKYYYINDKNHLELKPNILNSLTQTKQYAIINKDNILAYIPHGLKQNWSIQPIDNKSKNSCLINRDIVNPEKKVIANLCNSYKNSPGYYVFYNKTTKEWAIYPSEDLLLDSGNLYSVNILQLYYKLRKHYDFKIAKLDNYSILYS